MKTNQITRFTQTARQALQTAHREAVLEQSATIDTRHLLIGLAQLPMGESTAAHVLNGLGITADKLRRMPQADAQQSTQLDLSAGVKQTLERATAITQERGEKGIASAHLLAGVLADDAIPPLLMRMGTTDERVSAALRSLDDWTDSH
jgi:ATP-dependent Clp protease ATP-binding subunit ClpA